MEALRVHSRDAPDRSAVKDPERELSYAELRDEVALVAGALLGEGAAAGDRVVLLLANSTDFVVAALATLWIGAAFVPLAVDDPVERLARIVADCAPAVIVARDARVRGVEAVCRGRRTPVVTMAGLRRASLAPAPPRPAGSRTSYLIYTSGTTGLPKGVVIGSPAFAAAVGATARALGCDATTRALCVSPFHFDGSFGTLFPTLLAGGTVVIRPREVLLFVRPFFDAIGREAITLTGFSPSYLRLLIASKAIASLARSTLRTVAVGGEASSAADLRALWNAAPALRIFNRYGPTETAIAVTHARLTLETIADGNVPIGFPHDGVSFYLARADGTLIDGPGEIGELCIAGVQVMSGYWGAPTLTEAVLRDDIVPGRTVYRTGDLAYRDEIRGYFFVERADQVLKRRGVRISLVEINEAMRDISGASAVASVAYDDVDGTGIAAFVVGGHDPSDLRERARARLPEPMLPDRVVIVDVLPLTAAGKVDERRLLSGAGLTRDRRDRLRAT